MLQLFEISAKSFVKKQEEGGHEDKDLLHKLDTLLDQNKTIASGLTLMEEKIKHRSGEHELPRLDLHSGVEPSEHTEAELHGLYPGKGGRPRPGSLPGF